MSTVGHAAGCEAEAEWRRAGETEQRICGWCHRVVDVRPVASQMPGKAPTTYGFYVNDDDRRHAADIVERVTFYCKGLVIPDPERFASMLLASAIF